MRIAWFVNILQMLVVIIINMLLLPKLGALASAIALLANDVVGGVLFVFFMLSKWKRLK